MSIRSTSFLAAACAVATWAAVCTARPGGPPAGAGPARARAIYDSTATVAELLDRARSAVALGERDLAARYYEGVLIRRPDHLDAILELASVYEQDGRLEYAHGLLLRAERLAPDDDRIVRRRRRVEGVLAAALDREAAALMAQGRFDEALPRLSTRLRIDPDDPNARARRARCFLELGQLDAARADATRAAALGPSPGARRLIATIDSTREARQLDALRRAAYRALADTAHVARGSAARILSRILERAPDDAWARAELARIGRATPAQEVTHEGAGEATAGALVARVAAALRTSGAALVAVLRALDLPGAAILLGLVFLLLARRAGLLRAAARRLERRPALAGSLDDFPLSEVLHVLTSEPHTGRLDVLDGVRRTGTVWIDAGEAVHAEAGGQAGHDAVLHLLKTAAHGRFAFHAGEPTDGERTIHTPIDLLLIEHARRSVGTRRRAPRRARSRVAELLERRSRETVSSGAVDPGDTPGPPGA